VLKLPGGLRLTFRGQTIADSGCLRKIPQPVGQISQRQGNESTNNQGLPFGTSVAEAG